MKECKIIQDLMPNYIDELTSKESNEYIENHLKNCKECTNFFDEMKSKIEIDKTSTVKQEIDYMKKAKKKMNIGKKLLTVIGLLILILVVMFWREIYDLISYANICNNYMSLQDEIIEKGSYYLRIQQNNSMTYFYHTPEKRLTNLIPLTGGNNMKVALEKNSDIEGTETQYFSGSVNGEPIVLKTYSIQDSVILDTVPYNNNFDFEKKASFFELMSTIVNVRNIAHEKIDGIKYYILDLNYGEEVYIEKESGLITRIDYDNGDTSYYRMEIGGVTKEQLDFPSEDDHIVLGDYELQDRSKEKTTEKISNCEEEAGKIVSYDFKVSNTESEDLTGFMKTNNENLMIMKITNNITYKKMQEKWSGLRDLTDEDFKHYFVILVIDKDKTKEVSFSKYETKETTPFKVLTMNENEANSDYQYSASLVIIPNSEDVGASGVTVFSFDAKVE